MVRVCKVKVLKFPNFCSKRNNIILVSFYFSVSALIPLVFLEYINAWSTLLSKA